MIVLIFGGIGEGKSTELLRVLKTSCRPCVVIDTIKDTESYQDPKTKKLMDRLRFDKYAYRIYSPDQLNNFDKHKYVITPDNDEDFREVCLKLQQYKNLNLLIDELDMWVSSKFLPVETYNLFRYSRHMRFDIYCTMRNPYEIHRNIRALATYFWIFNLSEQGHLDYFEKYQKGSGATIRALKLHQYICLKAR